MKDAAKLLAYFAATIIVGAALAPPAWWAAQWLRAHGLAPDLSDFGFRSFYHRTLLVAALLLLWPLLRALRIRNWRELGLAPNPRRGSDLLTGFGFAAIPLLLCGGFMVALDLYGVRTNPRWSAIGPVVAASIAVPLIEEAFFRGLLLGVIARTGGWWTAVITTSVLYSIVHFLKAPEQADMIVAWSSGFVLVGQSFSQFNDTLMFLPAFLTLFCLGIILGDARWQTRSLWLPIGLHSGWILVNGVFNKIAKQETPALPWIGRNLMTGVVPILLALLTWMALRWWLSRVRKNHA